jgi:hypothetical protein
MVLGSPSVVLIHLNLGRSRGLAIALPPASPALTLPHVGARPAPSRAGQFNWNQGGRGARRRTFAPT